MTIRFCEKKGARKVRATSCSACELYRVAEQTECDHGDLLVVVQIERPQQARTASTIYVDVSGPSLEAERHIEVSPRSRIFGLTRTLCAHAEIEQVRI